MAILGLVNTESDANWRFKNVRRRVFYFYPNGAAPLMGLLSLMEEEETDDPEFSFYEKRLVLQRSLTVASAGPLGPFFDSGGTVLADPSTWTAGTVYIIKITTGDQALFRQGHVIKVTQPTASNVVTTDILGVVTDVSTANQIKVRAINTVAGIDNGSGENVGKEVLVVGNSFQQGIVDPGTSSNPSSNPYNLPINPLNYTQIFRSPFTITGTALKTSVKYDDTGAYKDLAKENSVLHMIEMEKSFIFGQQRRDTGVSPVQYFTGGVMWYLTQWEASGGGTAGYRPGGSALTADTDDDKRIIVNSSGVMTESLWDTYMERVFRVTNNTANEKLILIGSGALKVLNQLFRSKSVLMTNIPSKAAYGMVVKMVETPYGTVYLKSHPLFSQNPILRFNALVCDVPNMKYRYVQGRDTELLKNRQAPDADFRKDEWLGECGLELRFPESFMYLQNITSYAP